MKLRAMAYDKDENIITCSFCDKPAGSSFMSTNGIINYCMEEHTFLKKEEAQFIYNPNVDEEKIADAPEIFEQEWIIDLREDKD